MKAYGGGVMQPMTGVTPTCDIAHKDRNRPFPRPASTDRLAAIPAPRARSKNIWERLHALRGNAFEPLNVAARRTAVASQILTWGLPDFTVD